MSQETFLKLRKLKGEQTYSDFLNKIFQSEVAYVLDEHVVTNAATARGYSILKAAKTGKPAEWPLMVILLGRDRGA